MKKISFVLALFALLGSSCRWKHIKGNGNITTEERQVTRAERISLSSGINVELTQGPVTAVKLVGDDNILPYIIIREEGDRLVIRTKDNINYSTESEIKVLITTAKLSAVRVAGSGDVTGMSKFAGSDKLDLDVAGSGNIKLEVNTPDIEAEIAGSGNITLVGETQNQRIRIAGNGDYNADGLKSENAKVSIAGNGNVRVFADATLDINIAGSGDIFYKGNPTIKQKVVGSGDVKKID